MRFSTTLLLLHAAFVGSACQNSKTNAREFSSERQAIDYLRGRGNFVDERDNGLSLKLVPDTGSLEVTRRDIEAVNTLQNVVEVRVIAFEGISPLVFKQLKVLPNVKKVAIHYQMPAASIAYLNRFPNVEIIQFWADHHISCDQLPVLPKLRVLELESTQGKFSMESIRRISACRNLEEIEIILPVPKQGVALLKSLPKLRRLQIGDERY